MCTAPARAAMGTRPNTMSRRSLYIALSHALKRRAASRKISCASAGRPHSRKGQFEGFRLIPQAVRFAPARQLATRILAFCLVHPRPPTASRAVWTLLTHLYQSEHEATRVTSSLGSSLLRRLDGGKQCKRIKVALRSLNETSSHPH
jgi:hypothetical protein